MLKFSLSWRANSVFTAQPKFVWSALIVCRTLIFSRFKFAYLQRENASGKKHFFMIKIPINIQLPAFQAVLIYLLWIKILFIKNCLNRSKIICLMLLDRKKKLEWRNFRKIIKKFSNNSISMMQI